MSQKRGFTIEQEALSYLLKQGLKKITNNYSCYYGEIDLIMMDKYHLVFIEVRARASSFFGSSIESISSSKQKKIIKTALNYLTTKKIKEKHPTRFDVIGFDGVPPQINWIKNAFWLNY